MRLAKCYVLSRKEVTYPNVPFPDDPFIHAQVVHAPNLLRVTNQCPKLTQELHVSTYHIAMYVCVFFPFLLSPVPHCNTILNQHCPQVTRWSYTYDQMPQAFTQWIFDHI